MEENFPILVFLHFSKVFVNCDLQKLVKHFFKKIVHIIIRLIQVSEPLQLETLTKQTKMMQIFCRGVYWSIEYDSHRLNLNHLF